MLEGKPKPEGGEPDPAKIEQLLELELMQKRMAWQQARGSRRSWRALSFLFLFLVAMAALGAFFFFFSPGQLNELKSAAANSTEATPSPSASPQ